MESPERRTKPASGLPLDAQFGSRRCSSLGIASGRAAVPTDTGNDPDTSVQLSDTKAQVKGI